MVPSLALAPPAGALHPHEVAKLFGVTPKTVARWHDSGLLPGHRTKGGHRRFAPDDVLALLAFLQEVGER